MGSFEDHAFDTLVGSNIDDTGGDGAGTYPVKGNVWHLDCCNPENELDGQGWSIFNAILGWTNNATCMFYASTRPSKLYITNFFFLILLDGSVLSYVFYWLAVIAVLVYTKYKEVCIYIYTYIFILHYSEQLLTIFFPLILLGPNQSFRIRIRSRCSH